MLSAIKYWVSPSIKLRRQVSKKRLRHLEDIDKNLIIALCTPIRHATSCENAVRAVSGEETLEAVTLERTWTSLEEPTSSGEAELAAQRVAAGSAMRRG